MASLNGTRGLITGIANKRSIACATARAVARDGARSRLPGEISRTSRNSRLIWIGRCPAVRRHSDVIRRLGRRPGIRGLDFPYTGAFAPREELSRPFVDTSREGFRVALDVSAYSLVALARGAAPLMASRGGGSIVTLTYLGSDRVFTNYNVMGVRKPPSSEVRYLANGLPQNIRVNAISAGPITRSPPGISGLAHPPGLCDRHPCAATPSSRKSAKPAASSSVPKAPASRAKC
jgi:enoyl-[acyl-carrier protein] reductase I